MSGRGVCERGLAETSRESARHPAHDDWAAYPQTSGTLGAASASRAWQQPLGFVAGCVSDACVAPALLPLCVGAAFVSGAFRRPLGNLPGTLLMTTGPLIPNPLGAASASRAWQQPLGFVAGCVSDACVAPALLPLCVGAAFVSRAFRRPLGNLPGTLLMTTGPLIPNTLGAASASRAWQQPLGFVAGCVSDACVAPALLLLCLGAAFVSGALRRPLGNLPGTLLMTTGPLIPKPLGAASAKKKKVSWQGFKHAVIYPDGGLNTFIGIPAGV